MDIFLLILKTIGVIIITNLIATNLIGLFIRTLYQQDHVNHLRENMEEDLRKLVDDMMPKKGLSFMALLFGILILVVLFLYYKYLGIYVAVALLLMMVFRIPDLVDDIHGRKIDKKNYFLTFLTWMPILLIVWNYFLKS